MSIKNTFRVYARKPGTENADTIQLVKCETFAGAEMHFYSAWPKNKFQIYKIEMLIFIFSLFLFSCSPQQRLNRILNRHPELVKTDTIFSQVQLITEKVEIDTFTTFKIAVDTFTVEKEKMTVNFVLDTLEKKIYIWGKCESDTVLVSVPTEIKKVEFIKEPPDGEIKKIGKIFLSFLTAVFVFHIFVRVAKKTRNYLTP